MHRDLLIHRPKDMVPLNNPTDPLLTQLSKSIAQKEAKVGIAVAEDSPTFASASKEDSTALKTQAAVTVVILSGTFDASFFSMPLIEWNAIGDVILFRYAFGSIGPSLFPLTFLTLVVWVL